MGQNHTAGEAEGLLTGITRTGPRTDTPSPTAHDSVSQGVCTRHFAQLLPLGNPRSSPQRTGVETRYAREGVHGRSEASVDSERQSLSPEAAVAEAVRRLCGADQGTTDLCRVNHGVDGVIRQGHIRPIDH